MVALATLLIGTLFFWACQKDEIVSDEPDTIEQIVHKAGQIDPDCHTHCIDPDNPVYYEMTQQEVITWCNPRDLAGHMDMISARPGVSFAYVLLVDIHKKHNLFGFYRNFYCAYRDLK